MSFGILGTATDERPMPEVADYYRGVGLDFDASYAEKSGHIFDLSGSVWRGIYDTLLRIMKAEHVESEYGGEYVANAMDVVNCFAAAKAVMDSPLGNYIRMANTDAYDGEWFVGNITDEQFGGCVTDIVKAAGSGVAVAVGEADAAMSDDIEFSAVYDENDDERMLAPWHRLASRMLDRSGLKRSDGTYSADDAARVMADGMMNLFTYVRSAFDGVAVPPSIYNQVRLAVAELPGFDDTLADDFLSSLTSYGYCVKALAMAYEPTRIASENGVDKIAIFCG